MFPSKVNLSAVPRALTLITCKCYVVIKWDTKLICDFRKENIINYSVLVFEEDITEADYWRKKLRSSHLVMNLWYTIYPLREISLRIIQTRRAVSFTQSSSFVNQMSWIITSTHTNWRLQTRAKNQSIPEVKYFKEIQIFKTKHFTLFKTFKVKKWRYVAYFKIKLGSF